MTQVLGTSNDIDVRFKISEELKQGMVTFMQANGFTNEGEFIRVAIKNIITGKSNVQYTVNNISNNKTK